MRRLPHAERRERRRRARAHVDRRPAAHEHREAPAHEGLHAAVRRQRRRSRGARPAAALGARRCAAHLGRRRRARARRPALARRGRHEGGAVMGPFTGPTALWLALNIATFALHAVFASYVVAGAAYALVRRDELAARTRDRLPFMLGCAITAGVAPLLFLQLLHQRRFYTANLVMGPRWGAVVPAL